MPSIEQQILYCAAGMISDDERLDEFRWLMMQTVNPDDLVDLAVQEGLGGVLYKRLLNAGLPAMIGSKHRQQLQTIYYRTVSINLKLVEALKCVLQELNRKKIPVVLLQGVALLEQAYDDPGLRPMKDADLWVLPEDMDRLAGVLVDLGFQRYAVYPQTFEKGGTVIDIHTHILWADRIKSRTHLLAKGQNEIFQNCHTVNFDGIDALCLNPADLFLYQSLHTVKHNADRLIWLVDLVNLTRQWKTPNWAALARRAKDLGLEHIAAYAFFLLDTLLEFDLPGETRQSMNIRRPKFFERILLGRRMKKGALSTWGQLLLMASGQGLPQRMAFILENLFPRPEVLRQIFPNAQCSSIGHLYWKRVLQILGAVRTHNIEQIKHRTSNVQR